MMEVYTPQQWLSAFGQCPQLVINDEGYIYDGRAYQTQIGAQPIGRINEAQGWIYGKDYADVWPQPIGYIRKEGAVTKIYAEEPAPFVSPILYIRDGKVYTAAEYDSVIPVEAAVVKEDKPAEPAAKAAEPTRSSGGSGMKFAFFELGLILVIVFTFMDLLEKNPSMFAFSTAILVYLLPLMGVKKISSAIRRPLFGSAVCKKNALICAGLCILPLAGLGLWFVSGMSQYAEVRSVGMIYVVPIVLGFFYLIYRAVCNMMDAGELPQWPFKAE